MSTNDIKNIAAIYIESAEAAQNFLSNRDRAELDRHSKLFREASEKFRALIDADHSLYDCELREISYAITQHNFNDAKARYAELTKQDTTTTQDESTMTTLSENTAQITTDTTQENTMTENDYLFEAKYAEECGPDRIVNAIYIEEMIEDFHEFGWDSVDHRFNYFLVQADAESIRAFVKGLGIDGYGVDEFTNVPSKNAKYVRDHARCGDRCIVPEAKRIALANADQYSLEFETMF